MYCIYILYFNCLGLLKTGKEVFQKTLIDDKLSETLIMVQQQ